MLFRLRRLRHDLRAGLALVRQGSATAVNRSLEGGELLRLKFRLDALEAEIKEVYQAGGERAFQLIEREVGSIMNDKELIRLFGKSDQLFQEEGRIRFEMEQGR